MSNVLAAFHTFANVSKNGLGNVTVAYIYGLFTFFISENMRCGSVVDLKCFTYLHNFIGTFFIPMNISGLELYINRSQPFGS